MSSESYNVTLLREGSEEQLDNGNIKRLCTTVLVQGPCGTMVINPGSAWDGSALRDALSKHGIKDPSQVKYVVCTDGRAAHVGCLSIFDKAEMIIVGHDIQKPNNLFVEHDFDDASVPYEFDENLQILGTPGTMDQQVTVLVKGRIKPSSSGVSNAVSTEEDCNIAITGSIFADSEDAAKMGAFHTTSVANDYRGNTGSYLDVWRRSRQRLLSMADWIFPAYGGPFKVEPEFSKTPCVELP